MQMESMARRSVFKLESPFHRATILSLIKTAPRRVRTRDYRTQSVGQNERDRLQKKFRDGLRIRDTHCVISRPPLIPDAQDPF
ncbi:hypothetical protein N7463_000350 [Penicillium fimorum]|uniref:Uncharacterized protein n=1 Tax=Penicillium fimorum TaxID=1882269 RepID=A0A9X0CBF5_9EURO|nr:hypothetical protein N7463_000350 [Penicillium fimorum]